jgi:hypothetical protein
MTAPVADERFLRPGDSHDESKETSGRAGSSGQDVTPDAQGSVPIVFVSQQSGAVTVSAFPRDSEQQCSVTTASMNGQ